MTKPTWERLRGCAEYVLQRQGRSWLAVVRMGSRSYACSDACPERATRKALSDAGL